MTADKFPTRTITRSCRAMGGRSQRTGKLVGSRHRWNGGYMCVWCGNHRDTVVVTIPCPINTK